ncbi:MAG TPA: M20/M25/M40 family metallo-hydrolase [Pyrinomonadaceae bacterium]|nr:M20/M25/M40 family metallo-hydrolase [Pyrinomonadaceae bacterium]
MSLFLVAAIFTAALAQQPSANAPSVDRLRQIVTYLASDPLEGRRTGTSGATEAADFVANEFKRLGLQPGVTTANTRGFTPIYLQPFPYVSSAELGKNNFFFINQGKADDTTQFMVGEDWMPLGFSTNGSIKNAEVVFAGYGISSAELKYDDYAASNAKDRVAIVFSGTPDGDNPHGQFQQAAQIRFKTAAARAAGAKALLIISDEEIPQHDRLWKLSYDNAGEAGIPVVVISRKLAAKILLLSDPSLKDYEAVADVRKTSPPRIDGNINSADIMRLPFKGLRLNFDVNVNRIESPSFNVIGVLYGSDPKLKDEAILIGAHYDHLGRGGDGSLAPRQGDIHHGADDNASGVAGLLELARIFSAQDRKPRRTIVFIAFSGEEEGLLGSDYYVNHPLFPLANTVVMINMDMIGRLQQSKLMIGGIGTAQEWRDLVNKENKLNLSVKRFGRPPNQSVTYATAEFFALTLNEDGYGPSDHSSFYSKQIPVLFFWTGNHDDYHKPSDTADKINYEGEAGIVSFVERIIRDVDKNDKRPTYTVAKSDPQQRTGFNVYLGTIPNYADSNDGLKLDGVRDDSPAAKAGLKAGDKVVKLAGREVKNVYDYTYALGEMKAGQEYEVELMREGQRLTMKITPAARK